MKVPANSDIPMSTFRERLETVNPRNRNGPHSQVNETNLPTGAELTNFL